MTKDILDKIIKEKEAEAKDEELAICPDCKEPMIDNTFMRGSRLAGSMECHCGYKIMF
jgi:hypothetical protein